MGEIRRGNSADKRILLLNKSWYENLAVSGQIMFPGGIVAFWNCNFRSRRRDSVGNGRSIRTGTCAHVQRQRMRRMQFVFTTRICSTAVFFNSISGTSAGIFAACTNLQRAGLFRTGILATGVFSADFDYCDAGSFVLNSAVRNASMFFMHFGCAARLCSGSINH